MGIEKQDKQIGDCTYTVTMLPAKLGNRVLLKLMKSVAPVFAVASGGVAALAAGGIGPAIQSLSEDDFDWIAQQLAEKTEVNMGGDQSPTLARVFDLHFAGKYMEELEWLEFAIEVNYGPFFRELKRRAAEAKAKADAAKRSGLTPMPSSSTSLSTSTGESNAS